MREFGSFRLDAANHCLWDGETRVALSPKAFDVLCFLVERAGQLVTPEQLLEALWPDTFVLPEVIRRHILDVRKALGDEASAPRFIETVAKRGYRFAGQLKESAAAAAPETFVLPERPADRIGPSVAVLPFLNISPDLDNDYFSDGLTEEIINSLVALPGVRVVARTSGFRFKGVNRDIREIGTQLGATTVLEGSVRKSGEQLKITAQLINAEDGFHLWSQTFKRELGDIFAVQEEIAEAVSKALGPRLMVPPAIHVKVRTPDLRAHDLYLRGRFAQAKMEEGGGTERAIVLFEQAVEADPLYARAHAGLADFLYYLALWGIARPHDVMPKSKAAALRALELDSRLAEAHVTLGSILCTYDYDWERGRRSIETALKLDCDQASAYEAFTTNVCISTGRITDGVAALRRAIAIDPFRQVSRFLLLGSYICLGDHEATEEVDRTNPDSSAYFRLMMAREYEQRGELDRAREEMEKVRASNPRMYSASVDLCRVYTAKGQMEKAREQLAMVLDFARKTYVPATELAVAYWGVRDRAQTLASLQSVLDERTTRVFSLPSEWRLRGLHDDPAFHDILRRAGLQPVEIR